MPAIPPLHPGPFRERRSLADMANEQLRRMNLQKPKDPLGEGVRDAGRDDCLRAPDANAAVGGLLAAPRLIERALNDKCAK